MAKRGLNGSALKWIALLSMLIDHTAVALYYYSAVNGFPLFTQNAYYALRLVGRLAFPIFAFLLAEGYYHTRSVKKYLLRLFVFGLVSEVPFDLALRMSWIDWSYQNVYFTLFLGLLAICLWDRLTRGDPSGCGPGRILLGLLCIAVAAAAAELGRTDYGKWGVLIIVSMGLFRNTAWLRDLLAGGMLLASNLLEAAAFPDFILFRLYNGERGRQVKYLFYGFYPAHLALLALLCRVIFRS